MIVVIIAGGSGTRLWPLSTPAFPKHLLKLTNERSLLQNTVDRARKVTSTSKIYIIPEASHIEHVYEQLPELDKENILVEPMRRGTASCVAWALVEMKRRGHDQEPIVFLWGDQLIHNADGFAASVLRAGEVAAERDCIVFMGVEPSYPSTGLGYIHKGKPLHDWVSIFELSGFVEKPAAKVAEKYFASGDYLWNVGNLVGSVATFEAKMKAQAPAMWKRYKKLESAKDIRNEYSKLKPQALEYDFSEHMKDALVMAGNFDWMDVGSFKDLHDISAHDDVGNYVIGGSVLLEHTTNSYVRTEGDVPVAVIGLDNVVVVSTENGVLVANANFAQKVGDVAKKIQDS